MFERYYDFLMQENKKYNLTAITDREEAEVKHFQDSILAADLIPSGSAVLDIGAGAGFPSVPLKVVRDDLSFTLVDSVGKKIEFLEKLIKYLDLRGVTAIHLRIEDLSKNTLFDAVVARAVAKLNTLCEYALPFVKTGGIFIAYKAADIEAELEEACNALDILGGAVETVKEAVLDCKGERIKRKLVVIRKVKDTPSIYPRGGNKPRLKPL